MPSTPWQSNNTQQAISSDCYTKAKKAEGNMEQKNNSVMLGLIAIVVIGLVIAGTILLQPKDSTTSDTGSSASQSSSDNSSNLDANATFKDGTFSANGSYSSPGGNEEIAVTITISAGKVTDSSVTPKAASRESREYQADFVDGYKVLVTDKELATLRLSRVSGSSLTSRGFNQALNDIRTQAKT